MHPPCRRPACWPLPLVRPSLQSPPLAQALAELCGNDRTKYAALLSALVRVDMVKAYSEF